MAYAIFCLTTALMAAIFLLTPVMKEVRGTQPLNPVVQYSFISYSVFFLVSLLAAPLMFLSVIIPSFGDRFRFTLSESLSS